MASLYLLLQRCSEGNFFLFYVFLLVLCQWVARMALLCSILNYTVSLKKWQGASVLGVRVLVIN